MVDDAVAEIGEHTGELLLGQVQWAGRHVHNGVTGLDLQLPDQTGVEVLRQIREIDPQAVVIMMTAHGGVPEAVAAFKERRAAKLTGD